MKAIKLTALVLFVNLIAVAQNSVADKNQSTIKSCIDLYAQNKFSINIKDSVRSEELLVYYKNIYIIGEDSSMVISERGEDHYRLQFYFSQRNKNKALIAAVLEKTAAEYIKNKKWTWKIIEPGGVLINKRLLDDQKRVRLSITYNNEKATGFLLEIHSL